MMKKIIIVFILILILALATTIAYASGFALAANNETIEAGYVDSDFIESKEIASIASVRSGASVGTLVYTGSTHKTTAYIHASRSAGQINFHLNIGQTNAGFKYDIKFKIYNERGSVVSSKDFVKDPINASNVGNEFDLVTTTYGDGNYRLEWSGSISRISGSESQSGSYSFTIDNTNPTVVTSIKNNAIVNHSVNFSVNDANPSDLNAGSYIDGAYYDYYTGPTLELPTAKDKALNKVIVYSVVATDHYLNNSDIFSFTYDPIAPTISMNRADNNSAIVNNGVVNSSVKIGYADNLKFKSASLEKFNGSTWKSISIPSDNIVTDSGQYRITATDEAGNQTVSTFEIDKISPVINTVISNGAVINTTTSFTLSDSHPDKLIAVASIDNKAHKTYTGSTLTLPTQADIGLNKTIKYEVTAVDACGNISDVFVFYYDPIAPTISMNRADNNTIISNNSIINSSVKFDYADNLRFGSVLLEKFDGSTWKSISIPSDQIITETGQYRITATDAAGNQTVSTFEIDKIKPVLNTTINNGAAINTAITFTLSDSHPDKVIVTAYIDGQYYNSYNGSSLTLPTQADINQNKAIKYEVKAVDSSGNESELFVFYYDKIAPTLSAKRADTNANLSNGAIVNSDVILSYADNLSLHTVMLEKYNGESWRAIAMPNNQTVSDAGQYRITVTDTAGNSTAYAFFIDKTRAYIVNVSTLQSIFGFSNDIKQLLSSDNYGSSSMINLGYTAQAFSISINNKIDTLDYINNLSVRGTFKEYRYSHAEKTVLSTVAYNNTQTFNKLGEYEITVTNAAGLILKFKFEIDIKTIPNWTSADFVSLGNSEYLVYRDKSIVQLNTEDYNRGARISVNGTIYDAMSLSYSKLVDLIKDNNASINIIASGVDSTVNNAVIYIDESAPDIDNLDDILTAFANGSGSYLGLSKNDIVINYKTGKYEFPETAELKYVATTYNDYGEIVTAEERSVAYKDGESINFDGYFMLTITDANGNNATWTFSRLGSYISASEWSLKNEYFTAPQNYSVKLPIAFGTFNIEGEFAGKYSAEKRYMFASNERAIGFAVAAEYSVCVIKQETRWLYRPSNQGIQIAYTDEALLNQKILSVVTGYINATDEFSIGGKSYITRGTDIVMDNELLYNGSYINVSPITISGVKYNNILLIDKNFVFKQNNTSKHTSNIVFKHLESGQSYAYKKGSTIANVTGGADGLYEVRETLSSYELVYYVYIDNVAPSAEVISQKAGENDLSVTDTITTADEIVFQVKSFAVTNVLDTIDNFSLVRISGKGIGAVFVNNYPVLNYDNGYSGEYTISIYDRSGNNFNFKVYIMSTPPSASISTYGSGSEEYAVIDLTYPNHCVAMGLSVTHNTNLIITDDDGNTIDATVTSIIVRKGGRYALTILDNYNRTTIIELKYTKDMPDIYVSGVKAGGITNKNVTVTIPQKAMFSILFNDGSNVVYSQNSSGGNSIFTINAREENNGLIIVKAWYESDPDAYNDIVFTIDTIQPNIKVVNADGDTVTGTVNNTVYIDYDSLDVKEIYYRLNGSYKTYTKGQGLNADGVYEAVAKDYAGNETLITWVIDMHVQYSINYDKTYYSKLESQGGKQVIVTKSFILLQEEQASIDATMDGYSYLIEWGMAVNSNGLYYITLTDNVGNIEKLAIRVISSVADIRLETENAELLAYGTTTNKNVRLIWGDLAYVKDVTLKTGTTTNYGYVSGELITKEGSSLATITDVVGNMLKVPFVIDKSVDISFKYNKQHELNNKTLTLDFSVIENEPVSIRMTRNGEPTDCSHGEKITLNGEYELVIRDVVGNEFVTTIIVIGETEPIIKVLDISNNEITTSIFNHSFKLDWADGAYIESVYVNGITATRGEVFTDEGKYSVEYRDLLGRTRRQTLTIKMQVNCSFKFNGNYSMKVNAEDATLTLDFKIEANEPVITEIFRNGELTVFSHGEKIGANGDYTVVVKDLIGNELTKRIVVIGETAPNINIIDMDGNVLNTNIYNHSFLLTWGADNYIDYVNVNGISISSGDTFSNDGKYKIEVRDLLGRTSTLVLEIKTTVDYTITYRGSYLATINGREVVLTKSWVAYTGDNSTLTVYKDGEKYDARWGKTVQDVGEYRIIIEDSLGNSDELFVIVKSEAMLPEIMDLKGNKLVDGVTINGGFRIEENEFISNVTVNSIKYIYGEIVTKEGINKVTVTDVIGNSKTLTITLDNTVNYSIKYNGSFDKNGTTLTKEFKINTLEQLTIEIWLNGNMIQLNEELSFSETGYYRVKITDILGNTELIDIEIDSRPASVDVKAPNGKEITDEKINTAFTVVWADSDNIAEVTINGMKIMSGHIIDEAGPYTINVKKILGDTTTRKITIVYDVKYEVIYSGQYLYNDGEGNVIVFTKSARISGDNLIYEITKDGAKFDYSNNALINLDGLYHIILKDSVGNKSELYVHISSKGVLGEVNSNGEVIDNESTINKAFNIKANQFINEIFVDGVRYIDGEIAGEGKHIIEFLDVLGRKTAVKITIDYTVEFEVAHKYIDDKGRYVTNKFNINSLEDLELHFYKNDIEINLEDIAESGVYTAILLDKAGNIAKVIIVLDNNAPDIITSDTYTNKDIEVCITDMIGMTISVYKDGILLEINTTRFVLDEHGKYVINATDALGNQSSRTVTIKKIISISTNFTNGQAINYMPKIYTSEKVKYVLYLNEKIVENYELGGILSDTGDYRLELIDDLGNIQELKWYFMGAQKKFAKTNYKLPDNCEFEVYRNNILFDYILNEEGALILDTDGKYVIHISKDGAEYTVSFEVDVTPPELSFSGKFKDKTKGTGEINITCDGIYEVYFNGTLLENTPNTIKKVGKYKIIAKDDVGNIVEHEFELYYSPNAITWILILVSIFVGFCILIAIFKRFNIFKRIKNKINIKTEEKRK